MTSIDSNLLLYAYNADSPWHQAAFSFISGLGLREDVAVSEFVLMELYTLLRNPTVVRRPLSPKEAAGVVQAYRRHPRWALVGFDPDSVGLHDELWQIAARPGFPRRRIYDVRLALSLRRQGVTELATANVRDFSDLGFQRVWNPLKEQV